MTLREWLKKEGITAKEFAKRTGIPEVNIYRWITGRFKPRANYIMKIYKATNGEVGIEDWEREQKIT